jgi:hypothetical protein
MDNFQKNKFTEWITEHRSKISAIIGVLIITVLIPVTVYLVKQQQSTQLEAWICRNVEIIDHQDGTYNVIVTQGSASWWRIVSLANNQVVAGPQTEKIFDHLSLPAAEYQVQASDNQNEWTTQDCIFTIEPQNTTLECDEVKIYNAAGQPISVDNVLVGETIQIAVTGNTNHPDGVTKARFSFDNGANWVETTQTNTAEEFYLDWEVPDKISIDIKAQVYSPSIGWK